MLSYSYYFCLFQINSYLLIAQLMSHASALACNTTGTILVAIDAQSRVILQWTIPNESDKKFKCMTEIKIETTKKK